jgi:5-oxoprolinase (ATP-hydrolysing)/N-methylhydantoinase A
MASRSGLADQRYRIGFDIGGTFTDFILHDGQTGAIRLHKCLTTPADPSLGALEGLSAICAAAGIALSDVHDVVHGTTLVTNALIERNGAPLGLLTTLGFRDVLEMGFEQRYDIYDLALRFPDPLVPRRLRLEVDERVLADGSIDRAPSPDEIRERLAQLARQGVQTVAVCFLHSHVNPAHEQLVGAIAAEHFPALAVSLSSVVVGEIREYERTVTTCANAYVQPLMDRYIARLEAGLRGAGFTGQLRLMQSSGALASPSLARAVPISLLESGPAGGALASALFGKGAGIANLLAFDMGGTTAKACLVQEGKADIAPSMEVARVHRFKRGSGLPIKSPVIDMIEIGAGGGSVASVDALGLLKVGPHSAGADPGPACYGRGGIQPTVTDANLLLGYLDDRYFLGGQMALDRAAAERALGNLGAELGLSAIDAAWGVHAVVSETMASAARVHIVEKGRDPRRFAMVAFGGAGPAHAARVARILGVREVIVPPACGAASALGFLCAPLGAERRRSAPMVLDAARFDPARIGEMLHGLEQDARAALSEAGIGPDAIHVRRAADMRLLGQTHEIEVTLPDGTLSEASLGPIAAAFEAAYTRRYTHLYPGATIEAITWRVTAEGPHPIVTAHAESATDAAADARKGERTAWFDGGFRVTPVYDRYALRPGQRIDGPAIIEEREATTIVPPGDSFAVDEVGNLRIAIAEAAAAPARITAETPLAENIARIAADPVGLEIMWSRLVTVVEEMWGTVCRTAFSLIISESQDFACDLLDEDGETLAHSPRAMPVFNLTLPNAVKAMLKKFPRETLKPGDVLVTNDPWMCAGHLFDIAVVTPVFRAGRVVGLVGTIGHVSDIGGTKDVARAREVFEEGIQIPPLKLFREGIANEDIFALIGENVRNPEQVLGDIHAMVAANAVGAQRLIDFMHEYGVHDLRPLAAVVQQRAERAMRDAIRAVPDGVYRSSISNNPAGQVLTYPVKVTVAGDSIEVDFAGVPPQLAMGGYNCTLSYTTAHATYPLKCMLTPEVRGNAGCWRPFTVKAPEGSVLNCTRPAAVNMRTRVGWYIAPNLFRALADAMPDRVQANTGLPVAVPVYGTGADGRTFNDHLFMGGGQGASQGSDGKSGLMWPTSAANTPVELFESRTPTVVVEKGYIADSAGPGETRGGLGQKVRFRRRFDDPRPVLAGVFTEGLGLTYAGLHGGQPGGSVAARVRAGGATEDLGTGRLVVLEKAGDEVEVVLAGGAGFGDAHARSYDAIDRDLAEGYVTPAAAMRDHAVVVADGRVDRPASDRLRAGQRHAAQ